MSAATTTATDAAIDCAIGEQRLSGAVVLIARDGEVVYRRAAGLADRVRADAAPGRCRGVIAYAVSRWSFWR